MSGTDNFDSNYLTSLLHSSPASAEELEQTRQKISLYFRSLEKTQKRRIAGGSGSLSNQKNLGQSKTSSRAPAKKGIGAKRQWSEEAKYRARFAMRIAIMAGAILLVFICRAVHLNWLPGLILLAIGVFVWKRQARYLSMFTGLEDAELQKLALANILPSGELDKIPNWARRCGEGEVQVFREKWNDLNRSLDLILNCGEFERALAPSEHCLGILDYFANLRSGKGGAKAPLQVKGIRADAGDPLATLILRLIDDHELDLADKLSQRYVSLKSALV